MFVSPIHGEDDNLVTIHYRSEFVTTIFLQLDGGNQEIGTLPPSAQWSFHTVALPTDNGDLVLEVSGEIDVSDLWLERS
jgi:hypothetical protein